MIQMISPNHIDWYRFCNIQNIETDHIVIHVNHLINGILDNEDQKERENSRQKLKQFSLNDVLCALLFSNKDEGVFCEQLSKCALSLIGTFEGCSLTNFFNQSYDYGQYAPRDFSFDKFCDNLPDRYHRCCRLLEIIDENDVDNIKICFAQLMHLWLRHDVQNLSICYSNYLDSFVSIYHIFDLAHFDWIEEIHNKCINHIFCSIRSLNKFHETFLKSRDVCLSNNQIPTIENKLLFKIQNVQRLIQKLFGADDSVENVLVEIKECKLF